MKENKTIYVLYDWATEHTILTTHTKIKALAKIGERVLLGERTDGLKIVEIEFAKED